MDARYSNALPGIASVGGQLLNSALDEHRAYGHGTESSPAGRFTVDPVEEGLELVGKTTNAPE